MMPVYQYCCRTSSYLRTAVPVPIRIFQDFKYEEKQKIHLGFDVENLKAHLGNLGVKIRSCVSCITPLDHLPTTLQPF